MVKQNLELEKEEMSKIAHAQNSVISAGRCNFGHRKCRKLKNIVWFFGFYTKPETIVNRTIGDQSRPLVNFPDKLGILRKVMKNRLGLYAEACDVIISTQDKLPQEVTTQIICEAINLGLIKGVKMSELEILVRNSKLQNSPIAAPPSKSYTHRALFAAGLTKGKTLIQNPLFSSDISATISALRALGAKIDYTENSIEVDGSNNIMFKKSMIF